MHKDDKRPHPIWGFRDDVCKVCKQQKKIGLPSFYRLPKTNAEIPWRFALENMADTCEDCLKDRGLSRIGLFVPKPEGVTVVQALEAQLKIAKELEAESKSEEGKPKLY